MSNESNRQNYGMGNGSTWFASEPDEIYKLATNSFIQNDMKASQEQSDLIKSLQKFENKPKK